MGACDGVYTFCRRIAFSFPACRLFRPPAALVFIALWTIFAGALLSGCAVKLAPAYDNEIVEGLTKANEEGMTLFVAVSAAPAAGAKRQDAYNSLQGKLEAVLVQVQLRGNPPPPPLSVALLGATGIPNAQQKVSELVEPPTATIIQAMLVNLNLMRMDDMRGKMSPPTIAIQKNNFSLGMKQALMYEKFLER